MDHVLLGPDKIDFSVFDAFVALHYTMIERVVYGWRTLIPILDQLTSGNEDCHAWIKIIQKNTQLDALDYGERFMAKAVLDFMAVLYGPYVGLVDNPNQTTVLDHIRPQHCLIRNPISLSCQHLVGLAGRRTNEGSSAPDPEQRTEQTRAEHTRTITRTITNVCDMMHVMPTFLQSKQGKTTNAEKSPQQTWITSKFNPTLFLFHMMFPLFT